MPLQFRKGPEASRNSVTPASGEPLWTTDEKKLYIGDGSTAGGVAVTGDISSPLTSKGDIWVRSGTDTRLPVGSNGQILSVDSSEATGLKWIAAPAGSGGLANPATADLDMDGYNIADTVVVGNRDVSYNLATDSENLVTSGNANLVASKNVYHYANVTSALTITLPTPSGSELPYGQISVSLGAGGSVALASSPTYIWGKTAPDEEDGTIPSTEDDAFTIYYRRDPIANAYVIHLEYLSVIGGGGVGSGDGVQVVVGSAQMGTVNQVNQTSFSHTHNYISTVQDGSVYVCVVFVGDQTSTGQYTTDLKLTEIVDIGWPPQIVVGHYKPTQQVLDSGSSTFLFSTDNSNGETAQFFSFEVKLADASAPTDNLVTDVTSTVRPSVGPLNVTAERDGSLIVCVCALDSGPTDNSISAGSTNGFTQLAYFSSSSSLANEFMVHAKAVDIGTHATPTYFNATEDDLQLVAFVFQPGA